MVVEAIDAGVWTWGTGSEERGPIWSGEGGIFWWFGCGGETERGSRRSHEFAGLRSWEVEVSYTETRVTEEAHPCG